LNQAVSRSRNGLVVVALAMSTLVADGYIWSSTASPFPSYWTSRAGSSRSTMTPLPGWRGWRLQNRASLHQWPKAHCTKRRRPGRPTFRTVLGSPVSSS